MRVRFLPQDQIDARYPCGDGGWIHDRITTKELVMLFQDPILP